MFKAVACLFLFFCFAPVTFGSDRSSLLVGEWECIGSHGSGEETEVSNMRFFYNADGTGGFSLEHPMHLPAPDRTFRYSVEGRGQWWLEEPHIVTLISRIDIRHLGEPSPFVDMMWSEFEDRQQALIGRKEKGLLIALSETTYVERSLRNDQVVTCTRSE